MLLNHPGVIFRNVLLLKPICHGKIFLQEIVEGVHTPKSTA